MQDTNTPIIENTPNAATIVVPESPVNPNGAGLASSTKKSVSKKAIIIPTGIIIFVAVVFGSIYIFNHHKHTSTEPVEPVPEIVPRASAEESAKEKYTLERDDNGNYEVFGADDTKNNSGEAFVEYQNAISNAQTSSASEIFEAKLAKVIYYTAMEFFDEADAELSSIDTDNITTEQKSRYDEVVENLEFAKSGISLEDRLQYFSE